LAHLPVQYAALVCPPKVSVEDGCFVLKRPPSLDLEAYVALAQSLGDAREEGPWYAPHTFLREEVGGATPPRWQRFGLEVLENERYLLWIVPELKGSIVRWRDKRLGVELLRGFRSYGSGAGVWQDWLSSPHHAEGPVAGRYEVTERGPGRLTVSAATEEGLRVARTMALAPGDDRLAVTLRVHNPGVKPARLVVKTHPEFYSQGTAAPEVWAQLPGGWERLHGDESDAPLPWDGGYREPGGFSRWALRVPRRRLTVVNEFDPAELGRLFFYVNYTQRQQQVNLELVAPERPLGPGETRTIHGTYYATRKPPRRIR